MLATAAAWAVQSRGQELHGLLNGQQGPNYLNYPCRPLQGTWCWQEAGCRADVGLDPRHSSLECRHPKRQFSEQKQLGVSQWRVERAQPQLWLQAEAGQSPVPGAACHTLRRHTASSSWWNFRTFCHSFSTANLPCCLQHPLLSVVSSHMGNLDLTQNQSLCFPP